LLVVGDAAPLGLFQPELPEGSECKVFIHEVG